MYVESKRELAALLELIGYVEDETAPPTWRPKMVSRYPNLPTVYLLWVNGCRVDNKFFTFSETWRHIQSILEK